MSHNGRAAATLALMDALRQRLDEYLNSENGHRYAGITVDDFVINPLSQQESRSPSSSDKPVSSVNYYRFRISGRRYVISVRAKDGMIEFFRIPVSECKLLSFVEHNFRCKAVLELQFNDRNSVWLLNGAPAYPGELNAFLLQLLDDLLQDNRPQAVSEAENSSSSNNNLPDAEFEKRNLIFRMVYQQEALKSHIARELHDTVIADLMQLKRYLSGDRQLSTAAVVDHVDDVIDKLRDICQGFAPRHLTDWGLKTAIEADLEQLEQRSGVQCALACDNSLPRLPEMVELNLYRIVQEALNNACKYAGSKRIRVSIDYRKDELRITISDDGVGFDAQRLIDHVGDTDGGMGIESMKERAELIRSFYPVEFAVQSLPSKGTTVSLTVNLK